MTTDHITVSAATSAASSTSSSTPADRGFAADEAFFCMTASLFPSPLLFGAGVLLGTYDDEVDPAGARGSSIGNQALSTPARPSVSA
jgi:hypothetical protein